MSLTVEVLALVHAPHIFNAVTGNVAEYFYHFATLQEVEEWVIGAIRHHQEGDKEEYVYFDNGQFIGMVSPAFVTPQLATIGMWVDPDQQGKGYGTVLLKDMLNRLQRRGVEKVLYETDVPNLASQRLAEVVGFSLEQAGETLLYAKILKL